MPSISHELQQRGLIIDAGGGESDILPIDDDRIDGPEDCSWVRFEEDAGSSDRVTPRH